MPEWCTPIFLALAQRSTPCQVFFRDDDAGWADQALFALLDRFSAHGVPLDLALIPAALTRPLAGALLRRIAAGDGERLGIHQHGFAHLNHEAEGRKWEFGPSRSYAEQRTAIEAGHALIAAEFGTLTDPIFTPPWNRCTEDTVRALTDLGFEALSRDSTAAPLAQHRLQEIPVTVDWCKMRRPGSSATALGLRISACLESEPQCGIMLHHAAMDAADLALLDDLLPLLRDHANARCVAMWRLLGPGPHARDAGTAASRAPLSRGVP